MRNISNITFDLETLPGGDYPKPKDIKVPANYKNPEAIAKFQNNPNNLEDAFRKRALSYIEGTIFCIGFKVDDDPAKVVYTDLNDIRNEEELLKAFEYSLTEVFKKEYPNAYMIHRCTFVGHNIKKFDLPYLWLRARKYDCTQLLKILGDKPNDLDFEDTMMWSCVTDQYKGFVSLDKACAFFGLPGKGDIDGSMVYDMWKAKKYKEIATYCLEDVQKTYNLAVALGIIV